MKQTALDEFVEQVLFDWREYGNTRTYMPWSLGQACEVAWYTARPKKQMAIKLDCRYRAYCKEQDYVERDGFRICSPREQAARLKQFRYRQDHPKVNREYASYHDEYCCPLHGCLYGDAGCPVMAGHEDGVPCKEQEDRERDERIVRHNASPLCWWPAFDPVASPEYQAKKREEQDRQIKILRTEEYGSFQRVWRDNGEYRDEHCAGGFDRPVLYDVDCAVNGLGWYYHPGVWARMTEGQDRKEEAPGTGWKLSDEARKEIKELERNVLWL